MTARAPGTRRNPPLSPESRGQSETPPARGGVSSFRFSLSGSRRTLFAERRLPYVQGTTFTRFSFELSAAWEESGCQFGLTVRAVASRSSEALNYARRSLFHDEPPLAVTAFQSIAVLAAISISTAILLPHFALVNARLGHAKSLDFAIRDVLFASLAQRLSPWFKTHDIGAGVKARS